ncbi:RhoGAP-domain-containing protein [Rickenella mellea]|uniref:RhoGAP-domain-containing protein n=1 Tax=Rickenella mellea TaxID=50990 RepID=A0A4Y7QA14_9AGAM|nr:RhoGAP-domain-containing protein [Rickenella mellea]
MIPVSSNSVGQPQHGSRQQATLPALDLRANGSTGRPTLPTRASTVGTPTELDRKQSSLPYFSHARSEDLGHTTEPSSNTITQGNPSSAFLSPSRPITPADSRSGASSSSHSESGSGAPEGSGSRRMSSGSGEDSTTSYANSKAAGSQATSNPSPSTVCSSCSLPLEGAFVRALGNVWHLQCFKCKDCDAVVASKFFPIDGPDGKQQPLCERDYFRRLSLICGKCGQALRGSYITACNKKYHVEHFTCSVCPTLFGPQDSYYEHDGDVFCHFHYSTRFATKCAGCNSAILKQFVEINRNNRDECWHPECYMINKFWNVKIVSRRPTSSMITAGDGNEPAWADEERRETAESLKDRQVRMEQQVYRIWTVLSAFEESSAACISDMLRQVSNGQYQEAIRMAEKFILHVEVLFATIDDLETYFSQANLKGMSHVREARMLCRKTVDLFTLLSHPQESGARRMGMTQELLALVTGLAHYLKILIRIALTGGLKLERDHGVREAMVSFLDKLHLLAVEGGNPTARRMVNDVQTSERKGALGTQGVSYGFKSLAPENAGESFGTPSRDAPGTSPTTRQPSASPPSDLCVKCSTTVEEDCVRLGTYQRWHSHCVQCQTCGKQAAPPIIKEPPSQKALGQGNDDKDVKEVTKSSAARRPPANVDGFVFEIDSAKESTYGPQPTVIFCVEHAHAGCRGGFEAVSRLEQYAFLLNVALRRLSYLLKRRGLMPASPVVNSTPQVQDASTREAYRESSEIMRMKSVHLHRNESATARLPKRSTIVESPTGKIAQPTDVYHSQRSVDPGAASAHSQRAQWQNPGATPTQRSARSAAPQTQPQQARSRGPPLGQPQPQLQLPAANPISNGKDQQAIRPNLGRGNTEVMIVDDSVPNSPATGADEPQMPAPDDGITLADIPQIIEAEQAREQHRPLPRQSATPFIADVTPLELMIVKHAAVLSLCRSPLKSEFDLDEILELLEVKKSGFWNKLFKAGKQKKGIFGVPLEILVEREGADSMLGASQATLRVPSFIDDVISAMRQMDMSVEGIFRLNGNIRRLTELTEAIDRDPSSVDLTQVNPVQLAALLKKFLKALPEPLMTFRLYRLFMAAENMTNEEDKLRYLHLVTLLLPKGNRDTTEILFVFLKWVASFAHVDEETGNKMDLHNLATVISPNIFRTFQSKANDSVRVESFEGIRVMGTLLEHQDRFYTVPEEFLGILRDQDFFLSCTDMPSKDFLKKVDSYYRMKASGRSPGPGLSSPVLGASPGPFGPSSSSSSSTIRDGSEARLNTQRSDPALSRGRQQQDNRPGPYAPSPQPTERPQMNYNQSDTTLKNGQNPRTQSPRPQPPRLPHSPFSHPVGSLPASLSSTMDSGSGTFRGPTLNLNDDRDWSFQRPPPISGSQPSSRPSSTYTPRASEEQQTHTGFAPNGHTPAVQLRQRT